MATNISIHQAHEIAAIAGATSGAPVTITAGRRASILSDDVTFFTDDFALSRKLADAINVTVEEHGKSKQDAA